MFKNYFKIAFRNLLKNKVYSILNIAGLAVGMAVALIIGLWALREFSYNKFIPKYERLYHVMANYTSQKDGVTTGHVSSVPQLEYFKKEVPGVKNAVLCDWINFHNLKVGDKTIASQGAQIGAEFLTMFEYPLIKGNPEDVLKQTYSIVLTESTAKTLFGDVDPMGKMVRFDNQNNLMVTGILKDIPSNSTLQFNYLVPFQYFLENAEWMKESKDRWDSQSNRLFIELEEGAKPEQLAPILKNLICQKLPVACSFKPELFLYPLKDWNLYTNFENGKIAGGYIDYVIMFSIIGALVLIIACINFMNLSTARSAKRAKEVGIRKAIGSQRKQLIIQFLAESVLLTFISFLLCLVIVQFCIPYFNDLTGSAIHIPFTDVVFWFSMLGYVLFTGILAGSRPAFYLSAFQPATVLKGTMQSNKSAVLSRKVLVVIQFSCSVGLIISSFIIYQQIQFAQERDKGYDSNRLLVSFASPDLRKNYEALKNELLQSGYVESLASSSSSLSNVNNNTMLNTWPGKKASEDAESMGIITVSPDYFKTVGMELVSGKDFFSVPPNDTTSVIVNEALIKRTGLKDPLGKTINFNENTNGRIIGVVKDALIRSPYDPVAPMVFTLRETVYNQLNILFYRLNANGDTKEAKEKISKIFMKYDPSSPHDFQFIDDDYKRKFHLESLVGTLASIFAGLAIFISCLGLFGLAAYTTEQRRKEIGVRKVLGASVVQLWMLLCKDFLMLVLISCVITSPIVYYLLKNWLQNYNYHISITSGVFIVSAVIAMIITIITISFQAIRAAMTNPVKNLRTE